MRISAGAKAIVMPLCRHSRHRYRSKNRCGLSRRPLIKDPTSARVNPAPFEKTATGGIDTIIKDRSARWPVPGTKRETLSPSLYSLRLFSQTYSSSFFDRPQSFPSAVVSDLHALYSETYASMSIVGNRNISSFLVFLDNCLLFPSYHMFSTDLYKT